MVQAKKLDAVVSLHDPYPKEKMGELYANADIFLFTSIWQEPFGRVLVEAMASGVVVIGTATGGSGEILLDGKTGLTYPPGDSEALAERIFSLYSDRKMYDLLSSEGRKFAIEKFSIERMVNEIEDYFLTHILGEPRS
jgi:glycosyltransferase involved in cell wall biosynthesis